MSGSFMRQRVQRYLIRDWRRGRVILLLASCKSITVFGYGMFRARGREPEFLDRIQEKGVLRAGWLLRTKGYLSTKYEEEHE